MNEEDPEVKKLMEFLKTVKNPEILDQYLSELRQHYQNAKLGLIHSNKLIPELSTYLTKFNGPMHITITLLKFIIRMYELIGFNYTSDLKEYYRCHEKIFNQDPKFLSKSKLQGYKENDNENQYFIDNPLLNFELMQLSLTTIIHVLKKGQIKEYKALLLLYLNILSIYSYDKYVQVILRRYKFFKTLIQIIQG